MRVKEYAFNATNPAFVRVNSATDWLSIWAHLNIRFN